jgi:L-threonylcarbamoyladenylate synthase
MNSADTQAIVEALKNGAGAILPTDTVYGVALSAAAPGAAQKLNKIKNNPEIKPPQILCTVKQAVSLAVIDDSFKKVSALWPGALTIVAKSSPAGAALHNGYPTVGLRVPADEFILNILEALGSPLFASSANVHGAPVCETEKEVLREFEGKVDIIVLRGDIKTQPSAVVDLSKEDPRVIRSGFLSEEALKKLIISYE